MKWEIPSYNVGDIRTVKKFLLFPKRINDEVRWLEFATWEESHINYEKFGTFNLNYWKPIRWIGERMPLKW